MSNYQKSKQLDARKFIRFINGSVGTQLNEAVQCVSKAGKAARRQWQLVALNGKSIIFEDVNTKQYLQAEYVSKPEPRLNSIQPIEIIDESKENDFAESCSLLIESIESKNKRSAASIFNRMTIQRFSSQIVPPSGKVRCKDGSVYRLPISENKTFKATELKKIIKETKQHYAGGVVINEGRIVAYNGSSSELSIDPWLKYHVRARNLRQAALNGHQNQKFRKTILESANLLAEGKVEKAAKRVGKVLQSEEEFTVLTESQMFGVVKNCFATEGLFNDKLASDLGQLAHKLNLKVNRETIVNEWKNIGKISGSMPILENVSRLDNAPNFDVAHEKFVNAIFEGGGRDAKVTMLRTTLSQMAKDVPAITSDVGLKEKMGDLITRLNSPNVDEATLFEAEDIVSTVGDEMADTGTLDDFDSTEEMGEFDIADTDEALEDEMDSTVATTDDGKTTVVINSPLVQVGGTSSNGGEPKTEDDGLDLEDDFEMEGDMDLGGDGLDLEDGEEAGDDDEDPLGMGGDDDALDFSGFDDDEEEEAFGESVHYEMKSGSEDEMPRTSFPKRKFRISESIAHYGSTHLKDAGMIEEVVAEMHKRATANCNMDAVVENTLVDLGINIPKAAKFHILAEAKEAYDEADTDSIVEDSDGADCSTCNIPMTMQSGKMVCSSCIVDIGEDAVEEDAVEEDAVEEDAETIDEDQLHKPNIDNLDELTHSINPEAVTESVNWTKLGDNTSQGIFDGVEFVLGHLSPTDMEIRTSGGAISVPIPKNLCESVLGSMNLATTKSTPFHKWIKQIVESIRPMNELNASDIDDEIDKAESEIGGDVDMMPMFATTGGEAPSSVASDSSEATMGPEMPISAEPSLGPMGELEPNIEQDATSLDLSPQPTMASEPLDPGAIDTEQYDIVAIDKATGEQIPVDVTAVPADGESSIDLDSEIPDEPTTDIPPPPEDDDDSDTNPFSKNDSEDDDSEEDDEDDEDDDSAETSSEDSSDADESDDDSDEDDESDDSGDKEGESVGDSKKSKPSFLTETIQEGYADESYNVELGFYWHNNSWHLGDGLNTGIDEPAPAVVQKIAAEAGLTSAVSDGHMDPDSVIFEIKIDIDHTGTEDSGSYDEEPSSDMNTEAANAIVAIQTWNASGKESTKQFELTDDVQIELFEAYGGALADYAADKYASDGKPTYNQSDYE